MGLSMQKRSTRGIQFEDVAQAADALLREGMRPTIERIRLHIGRGSPNTVSPMLEQWFSGLGQRLGMSNTPGQGADMPDQVLQAARKLWETATAEAHHCSELASTTERERLRGEFLRLEETRRQQEAREQAVSERVTTMENALQLCTRQLEESNARWNESQRMLSEQSAEIALNQGALARCRDESTALQRRLDTVQIQAKEEQSALEERHHTSERRWLVEVDRARQDVRKSALLLQQSDSKLAFLQQQTESLKNKTHARELEQSLQVSALQLELANALQDAEKTRVLFLQVQQQGLLQQRSDGLGRNATTLKPLAVRGASLRKPPIRRTLGKNRN